MKSSLFRMIKERGVLHGSPYPVIDGLYPSSATFEQALVCPTNLYVAEDYSGLNFLKGLQSEPQLSMQREVYLRAGTCRSTVSTNATDIADITDLGTVGPTVPVNARLQICCRAGEMR